MIITGTHIAYLHICHRKLWLFAHGLQMEHTSDTVSQGRHLSQTSYEREKKEQRIDDIIVLDWVKDGIIHEVKKSPSAEFSHQAQVLYYLWYLKQKGYCITKARLDYPLLKTSKEIELTPEYNQKIPEWIEQATTIIQNPHPPKTINKKKLCKKCSYYELCYA